MKNKTVKRVRGWAIWHKHKDMIMEVNFIDCGDFKPTKEMFVDESGRPAWQGIRYTLIPCEITYQIKAPRGKRTK